MMFMYNLLNKNILSIIFILMQSSLFVLIECSNKYKDNDDVIVYVNKIGPYWNPHETYHYYSLAVCRPDRIEHRSLTLGEVLDGDRMAKSMYKIKFKQNIDTHTLCKVNLNEQDLKQLREAIEEYYYFEFVVDDISMRGFLGKFQEANRLLLPVHTHHTYLYTHYEFKFEYNEDRIVFANVSTSERTPTSLNGNVQAPIDLTFTYSVTWTQTKVPYEERMRHLKKSGGADNGGFFPKYLEIHWLSIINSIVLVFLLLGFVIIILSRILRNDFLKYNNNNNNNNNRSSKIDLKVSSMQRLNNDNNNNNDDNDDEDNGWKIIHTDVFRFPPYKSLFCACIGVGMQFVTLAFGILLMALFGLFNVHRHGSLNTAAFLLFALTSCVSGYTSARLYRQMNGDHWVWNVNLTACLYTLPFFFVWSCINSVAWYYGSTQALPATTILVLLLIWILIGYPLTIVGAILGRNSATSFDAPCRTKNIPREIPAVAWYRSTPCHMLIGGFLPFSAISVELYYIFSTLWGRDQYTLYGILTIVFIILLCVTACVCISLTYFQLSGEDWRWWWKSIVTGGATGLFIQAYALYYYYERSNMSGSLQFIQYFGYTLLTCYMFFLMLGTIGFFSSLKFIKYIYVNIKMD